MSGRAGRGFSAAVRDTLAKRKSSVVPFDV
jgi:hypothetical protein